MGAGMAGYLMTGVVATLMCVQARQQWLAYIPGTFAGCCATFGAAGEWRLILPSLIIGALFGYLMKASGLWLSQKTLSTGGVSDPACQADSVGNQRAARHRRAAPLSFIPST